MSTALIMPNSSSPFSMRGRKVLLPVYGCTVIWNGAAVLTTFASPLARE